MSKMTWLRWGLVLAASTVAALNPGICVSGLMPQQLSLITVYVT